MYTKQQAPSVTWLDWFFIRRFIKALQVVSPYPVDMADLRRRTRALFHEHAAFITDAASRRHVLMCASLLAAYLSLRERSSADDATLCRYLAAAVRKASGERLIQWYMRLSLRLAWNRERHIRRLVRRSSATYGSAFDIEVRDEARAVTCIVRRCGYFEFFRRAGYPFLTKVLCAWDSVWSDEFSRRDYGVTFRRPSTIADGAPECRFEFRFSSQP